MRKLVFIVFLLMGKALYAAGPAADYLNTFMMDIIQYEKGSITKDRSVEIMEAFKQCTDTRIKEIFFNSDYFEERANGKGIYVKTDSLKWAARIKNTCYMDIDGDRQKEIFFHEKNIEKNIQLAVILKKRGDKWEAVYNEYGVFSNLIFSDLQLKRITVLDFKANANPCHVFKISTVISGNGELEIVPYMKINVPHYYHFPVKVLTPERSVKVKIDTLFFYDQILFSPLDFPYRKEVSTGFDRSPKFNTIESEWMDLVPTNYYQVDYVENRGDFSSVLVAINQSYLGTYPEYLFLYVPNDDLDLSR